MVRSWLARSAPKSSKKSRRRYLTMLTGIWQHESVNGKGERKEARGEPQKKTGQQATEPAPLTGNITQGKGGTSWY